MTTIAPSAADEILAGLSIFPDARERLAAAVAGLDAHTRRRVLQDNARELYGIAVPTT